MLRRSFVLSALAAPSPRSPLPPFSWKTVPVFGHMGKRDSHLTSQEAAALARFPMVSVEKSHAIGAGVSCEQGIYTAARQIKEHNPKTQVYFYLNLVINWPNYDASKTFDAHPDWHLKAASGKPVTFRDRPIYDLSNPEMRDWWSDTVAAAMKQAPLDGVFADAVPKISMLEAQNRKLWGDAKYEAVERGLRDLLAMTKRKIGPGKVLLINGLRGETKLWADGGARYLEYVDAAMVEHFAGVSGIDAAGRLRPEVVDADYELMRVAAAKGKMLHVKAWPAFTKGFPDTSKWPDAYSERARLAREEIEFPLAAFLIGAQENCYFGYAWSYGLMDGWTEWYPEFDRPLGPPRGPAKKSGWSYTREFEHARVEVDLSREWGKIVWA